MESLLQELASNDEDFSFGLNIITTSEQQQEQQPTSINSTKKKKNNKYEKRRNKARQAKAQQQQQRQVLEVENNQGGNSTTTTAVYNQNVQKSIDNDNDNGQGLECEPNPTKETIDSIIQNDLSATDVNITKNKNVISKSNHNDDDDENDDRIHNSNHTETNNKNNNINNSNPIVQPSSLYEPQQQSSSRKNQHQTTIKSLENEQNRAQYMSNFHARPYEMDRKSGASSYIKKSTESTHIFGNDTDDDDDNNNKNKNDDDNNNNDNKTTNMKHHPIHKNQTENNAVVVENNIHNTPTKRKCPFLECGLHPKIVQTITLSKNCGLFLKRPTIIQRNSWRQLLVVNSTKNNDSVITTTSDYGNTKKCVNLFIQSETGSGKTLGYFLPVLQSLAIDTTTNEIQKLDRATAGTRAIILCPTRELAIQTFTIAEKLCQNSFPFLVAGCLSGGEKRKSEKARLRKGVTILIATPGRLLDHLDKTECLIMSLKKGNLKWIVLDESDRLLDMGLGNQVEQVIQSIRSSQGNGKSSKSTWQSILVSATITERVQSLASKLLGGEEWVWARASQHDISKDKLLIEQTIKLNQESNSCDEKAETAEPTLKLSTATPHQLTQLHMVVSAKLRLTALVAFLIARVKRSERVVVFMSTCDGVNFHHELLNAMSSVLERNKEEKESTSDGNENYGKGLFGSSCSLYRLHGNVPHKERQSIMNSFSNIEGNKKASILFATDVAARGLNLPAVDWIVQYDPPCEIADYIHRAGRAARAGKSGHALLFLLPSEIQYVEILKLQGLQGMEALSLSSTLDTAAKLCPHLVKEGLLKNGHGESANCSNRRGEAFSTVIQARLEECIVEDDREHKEMVSQSVKNRVDSSFNKKQHLRKKRKELKSAVGPLLESARKAYSSYIRGYQTKEKIVRHIFSPRALHLGHIARSFALKEAPKTLAKAITKSQNENDLSTNNDPSILKSTGKKRNTKLAFGKNQHGSSPSLRNNNPDIGDHFESHANKRPKVTSMVNHEDSMLMEFF